MFNVPFAPGLLCWTCIAIVQGLLSGCCYADVAQLLHMDGTDQRMPGASVISSTTGASLLSCGVRCTRTIECLSVSYHPQGRTCELSSSSGNDVAVARVSAAGWKIYRLEHDCPNSVNGFVRVGSMTVKLCTSRVTRQKAKLACGQFGRLVKLNTTSKMAALRDYLTSYPGDVWIDGYGTSSGARREGGYGGGGGGGNWGNEYRFSDLTLMPPCSDAYFWDALACGVDLCVMLDWSMGFRMADDDCSALHAYVCELA